MPKHKIFKGIAFAVLFMPFLTSGQDFFVHYPQVEEKTAEKRFFEFMDSYMPRDPGRETENYIRDFDPALFQDWISWIMDEAEIPGISLFLLKDGDVFWKTHLGYANLEQGLEVNDSTLFLTASISKTIVLTAAMQLYEQQLFELDDDINGYLPFLIQNPNYPDNIITFRHLMTHLSSIADNAPLLNDLITYGYDSPIPLGAFLEGYLVEGGEYYSSQNFLPVPPETEYEYSNVGISLLAYLVEILSGRDFEDYCQQYIFGPLGMDQTSFKLANLDQSRIAVPYLQQNDTLIPSLHPGFPVYPAGSLRTSAHNLSKFIAMYMNNGTYNQAQVLKSSTIELITSFQYPELLFPDLMGLVWHFKYGFFKHGGYFPGAQTECGFSWDNSSGLICMGNSANQDWSWFMEYLFLSYSRHYQPFSVEGITLDDEDGNGLLESGETIQMTINLRNNVNIIESMPDIQLLLSSFDPNITITVPQTQLGSFTYLETKDNQNLPFVFDMGGVISPYTSNSMVSIASGNNPICQASIELEIGTPGILLVNDGTSFGGMFIQPKFWYSQVFDSLGREVYHYDLNLLGDPGYDFLSHFPVVIWYTGLQNELTLTPENQEALSQYLVNGGNLFLSGQNITEDLLNSPFLSDYLHVKQLNGTYSGQDTLVGKTGDPIGDNLLLTLNQGWDALFQSSMSELQPVNGGEMVFNYYSSFSCAAVRSMSPVYKTVFFGFGFEGINGFKNRLEVMDRILEYFEGTVGTDDGNDFMCKPDQTISFINPVSVSQSLQYVLSTSGDVCICFYDLQGRIMHVFEEGYQPAGTHHLDPFKSQIVPGIYIYRMQGGAVEQTGKIVVFP